MHKPLRCIFYLKKYAYYNITRYMNFKFLMTYVWYYIVKNYNNYRTLWKLLVIHLIKILC